MNPSAAPGNSLRNLRRPAGHAPLHAMHSPQPRCSPRSIRSPIYARNPPRASVTVRLHTHARCTRSVDLENNSSLKLCCSDNLDRPCALTHSPLGQPCAATRLHRGPKPQPVRDETAQPGTSQSCLHRTGLTSGSTRNLRPARGALSALSQSTCTRASPAQSCACDCPDSRHPAHAHISQAVRIQPRACSVTVRLGHATHCVRYVDLDNRM